LNLPNSLTLARLVAIPALMVLLGVPGQYNDLLAAAVFVAASITDTLDGNIARARHQVTELGKFLDPLADKLLILSVLIALTQRGQLPAWVVVVIFGRELLVTVLRSMSASQGSTIAATPFGKTKTVTQVLAVLLLILERPYPAVAPFATAAVAFALGFTVLSGVDYLWRFRHVLQRLGPDAAAVSFAVPDGGATGSEPPIGSLARDLHDRLGGLGLTFAVAESCTGGMLASLITDQPGSSGYFKGGVVAYSNEIKERLLGVPADLLARHGAVSAEVARAMAEGARATLHADVAVAVTGIAGPEADGTAKPVGLTHIWLADAGGGEGREFIFGGDRGENRRRAVQEALTLALGHPLPPRRVGGSSRGT
jgi:CDP-diacylglycerol--glycerol-3-phosphate 3-phosphatidyltransferase